MSPFCSSICSSVVSFFSSCFLVSTTWCCPFLSFVFSVYDLLLKQVFGTSALFVFLLFCLALSALFVLAVLFFFSPEKHFCFYSFVFLNILLFCSHSLISVFPLFLFFLPLLNVCLFLTILFDLIFLFRFFIYFFYFYILSLLKHKKSVFLMCFSFSFFRGEIVLCVFSFFLFFSSSEEGFYLWSFVLTHFEAFFFISSLFPSKKPFQNFSLLECLLYLFISSFLHPLSTCSICCLSVFSRFSHLFPSF